MSDINVLAIDIAKSHFQLHGATKTGRCVLKKSINREQLVDFISNLAGNFKIAMEACGGANYWGRTFESLGYQVKLISPQYVKGFLQGSKNDANDASAIATAAQQESIPTVSLKSVEQQNYQTLHRVRESFVSQRTATSNMIRGFLLEYGEVIPVGFAKLKQRVPELLEDAENGLSDRLRVIINDLYLELLALDKKIVGYDKEINAIVKDNEICKRLMRLKGVGPISALFSYATMGNAANFKNGRHYAAYLGLVPKEYSTGGKHKLLGISKRGNTTMRSLLIHGARAVVKNIGDKQDKLSVWLRRIKDERGYNKCCVALANKLARHIWAIMANGEDYKTCPSMIKN